MRAVILAGGAPPSAELAKAVCAGADLIVCADAGALWAQAYGIRPHLIMGDFDSMPEVAAARFQADGIPVMRFSADKDKTDTQLAVEYALDHGASDMALLGATGSRLDHVLANIMLLMLIANRGASGRLIDDTVRAWVANGAFEAAGEIGDTFSILPLGADVALGGTYGLQYPVADAPLPLDQPYAVSNRLAAPVAGGMIRGGWALLVHSKGQ